MRPKGLLATMTSRAARATMVVIATTRATTDGVPESQQARVHEQADDREHGEHQPAGQALEHDAREAARPVTGVSLGAGQAHDVAPDRARQHIRDEMTREIVVEETDEAALEPDRAEGPPASGRLPRRAQRRSERLLRGSR